MARVQLLIHVILSRGWPEIARVLGPITHFIVFFVFSVWPMPLVTKIGSADFFPANLTCCSYLAKTLLKI